jgi:hypothetical protein
MAKAASEWIRPGYDHAQDGADDGPMPAWASRSGRKARTIARMVFSRRMAFAGGEDAPGQSRSAVAVIIIPVVVGGRTVGTLDIESDQIGAFDRTPPHDSKHWHQHCAV